jgi:hypothetical protein
MRPNTHQSHHYDDQSIDQSSSHLRATVQEAAKLFGISPEAVRARIQRGTLPKDKDPDGTVDVRLNDNQARPKRDRTGDETSAQSTDQTHLVASLDEQVSFLRAELLTRNEELRRKDHIIAALSERIPELSAPTASQEASEAPERVNEEPFYTPLEPEEGPQRRSWPNRFFFGP